VKPSVAALVKEPFSLIYLRVLYGLKLGLSPKGNGFQSVETVAIAIAIIIIIIIIIIILALLIF
jgi:hypothetical protein